MMKAKQQKPQKKGEWKFSSRPILFYQTALCLLVVLAVAAGGVFLSLNRMRSSTVETAQQVQFQIESRVGQALSLLHSLAAQERYYSPDAPVAEKVKELDSINSHFGYMMICYVDADVNVVSADGSRVSLASRDYMQRLFASGQDQVTDSFSAGSDGKTLNYTIAVPLTDGGEISGALFCAIYFDEIVEIMKTQTQEAGQDAILLGSQNQIMSATNDFRYGDSYIDILRGYTLQEYNAGEVEGYLLSHEPGTFWSMRGGNLFFSSVLPVEGTSWNFVCSSSLWETYSAVLPDMVPIMLFCVLFFGLAALLTERYMRSQLKVVDLLVQSVQELEHKIYQDDRPDSMNFNEIIHLTSTGLSDGLTGVATRTVFVNQLSSMLKKLPPEKLVSLCFVDLDDLKKLNDTYGHETGDISLKSVGYVLREYEKKYDGLVGRYGGDEFVLLLTDIDSDEELREVLGELVLRLQATVMHDGTPIQIKCSVGVSIWDKTADTDTLVKQADEALYFVKQNGKSYYKIYQDES